MKRLLVAGAALAVLGFASPAAAVVWPGFGADTLGPALIITLNANGTASVSAGPGSAQGPYDSVEDTYIGVVNNFASTVNAITISSPTANDVFGFDGDGIDTFGAPGNASDSGGYGGPLGFFSNVTSAAGTDKGVVNFLGGLASGGNTYFSLEGPLTTSSFTGVTLGGVPEPASWALMILGVFSIGAGLRLRRREDTAPA